MGVGFEGEDGTRRKSDTTETRRFTRFTPLLYKGISRGDTPIPKKGYRVYVCSQVKVNYREKEKQVLDNILGPGRYDARIRPSGENGTDGPAIVRVNLFVRSIATISDIKMAQEAASKKEKHYVAICSRFFWGSTWRRLDTPNSTTTAQATGPKYYIACPLMKQLLSNCYPSQQ
ncbi:hypothetical protein HZH66_007994 [Vespula vulgaris]|uniref:Uncharacterized protein n=1 Tax=Vespula vulgaris TaxID=7454 RepID=A0A834N3V4_VESVU|nr:hypothetical protein HZH66_007994 [Vespula vulgaris]